MMQTLTSFSITLLLFLPGAHSACETRTQAVTAWYRAGNTIDDFLTQSQAESVSSIVSGRYYRGIVGYLWTSLPATNGIAMYRYITNNMGHFYTTNTTVIYECQNNQLQYRADPTFKYSRMTHYDNSHQTFKLKREILCNNGVRKKYRRQYIASQ